MRSIIRKSFSVLFILCFMLVVFCFSNAVKVNAIGVKFDLYSGELTEGDYIIYYGGKAMNTTVTNNRLQYEEVTPADNCIMTIDHSIVWHIAPSETDGYWIIYNAESNKYAASNGTNNQAQMLADCTDDKALWSVSGIETYEFVNKHNYEYSVNKYLRNNGTYGFACYADSRGGALTLYKLNSKTSCELFEDLDVKTSLMIDYNDSKYFEKVTENLDDFSGIYLIVCESSNVALAGGLETLDAVGNRINVKIFNNRIPALTDCLNNTFVVAKIGATDNYSIKSFSNYYIGKDTSGNGLQSSAETVYTNTISIDDGDNAIITSSKSLVLKYNSASNQLRFRYFGSGQNDIQLYKLHDGIREINSVNIRFKVNSVNVLKDGLATEGTSVSYGFLYSKSEKTSVEMEYGLSEVNAKNCTNFNADGSYSLLLKNIPDNDWDTVITVRAYVCVDGNYYYSNIKVISIKDACTTYINNYSSDPNVQKAMGILEYIKNYEE